MIKTALTCTLVLLSLAPPVLAQGCDLSGSPSTSLRTPLIPCAPSGAPGTSAYPGQPPAIGNGPTPVGVNPGMLGPSTLIPSNPITPANTIGSAGSYTVPFNPATQSFPGTLGPSTWAPPPPSTPGFDPGMVHAPLNFYAPPVSVVPVSPGGGLHGGAPMQRWGGQTTRDFGYYRNNKGPYANRAYDFAVEQFGSTSQDGPWQTRPGAVPTQDLYGRRFPTRTGNPTTQTIAPF
jgi:hypothetical protein